MNRNQYICLISLFAIAIGFYACTENPNDNPTPTVHQNGPTFNLRYCEIILANFGSGGTLIADVYGTPGGCSDCPQEQWEALDFEAIAQEENVFMAIPNGPRYTVADSAIATSISDTCAKNYGGIPMRWLASIEINPAAVNGGYAPSEVERTTAWYFYKGSRVYLLQDSTTNNCYIMQAFSQIVDSTLQIEDLQNLGDRLEPPAGWAFKTMILEEELVVPTINGFTTVVQDELRNTYQYLPNHCP